MSLKDAYSIDDLGNSRSEFLKRNKEKSTIAVEFNRMRDRVDKLIMMHINFNGREEALTKLTNCVHIIEISKQKYELKVYQDLVENDLTEDKLKLAESTKINIGKFNGCLGTGDDFYTFKSKFLKAYGNHPKNLMVGWL